jgi:hypothetical protein
LQALYTKGVNIKSLKVDEVVLAIKRSEWLTPSGICSHNKTVKIEKKAPEPNGTGFVMFPEIKK